MSSFTQIVASAQKYLESSLIPLVFSQSTSSLTALPLKHYHIRPYLLLMIPILRQYHISCGSYSSLWPRALIGLIESSLKSQKGFFSEYKSVSSYLFPGQYLPMETQTPTLAHKALSDLTHTHFSKCIFLHFMFD